jgi:hypothetical protein
MFVISMIQIHTTKVLPRLNRWVVFNSPKHRNIMWICAKIVFFPSFIVEVK